MIINFRKVFEVVFKSFDIAGDTKAIAKLEKDGHRFVMVIKRHWIFGVLNARRVLLVIIIGFINVYLLFSNNKDFLSIGIGIFLMINIVYWVIIIGVYIMQFYRIQGNEPYIEDIHTCLQKNKENDTIFTNFFNQTVFLLFVLIGITIFSFTNGFLLIFQGKDINYGVGIINGFLLLLQTGLFYGFLHKMMDQEMDFKIVIPGQILFFNQSGILGESQSMNANKIKTMNTKYNGLFGSFFNYGDILILSEGDSSEKGVMTMDYIGNPKKTVKEIEKMLKKDLTTLEKDVNILLQKIKAEMGIQHFDTPESKNKLKEYIKINEMRLKEIFEKGDEETREEIREIFILSQE